uniref:Amiloride-sensitive amine oxidase [copper-containing] n=1 Tax=Magallana gigas TaxID=29159 RepID=K1R5L2_MAGGI
MNLKHPKEAQIDQSFIHAIEVHTPRKSEVIDFWDNNGPKPKREAKVFIMHGDQNPPFIGEYIVGPLPNITYAEIINTTARTTKVPYIYRPFSSFEFMAIYRYVIGRVAKEAHQVLVESYNATPFNCGNQCLRFSMTPISSGYLPEGTRKSWFWFAHNVEFYTLHPLDFQFLVDMTSSDPKEWRILDEKKGHLVHLK